MAKRGADRSLPFHPAVQAWFRDALGEPTPAQSSAWPRIQRGETTLLLAPTGSGKTLAAFLSAIDRLAQETSARPVLRVLYVSPLKALAADVERNLRAPLAGIHEAALRIGAPLRRLDVAVRTGDTPQAERARIRRSPPDILITTPESLYLLLTSDSRAMLASVDTVIVDEIHQLAPSKRGAHLFLSLERLEALRPKGSAPLQRVGLSATQRPLDEIARLLGGLQGKRPSPRPVAIVDASAKKALSITVEVPPPLPDGLQSPLEALSARSTPDTRGMWPALHARLVERIRAARSTMIFVNSRRLAERLATALNETAEEEIALAHHGSVAKESRRVIEERLKAGELPAIVATSSLELGIDMGAVDQVIQIEAPPSVASGIQRIGRASHHVGGVPAGVLVPKHAHDLLACAAAATGIEDGDVEATYYPRNPLDVLAQQIVAIAAVSLAPAASTATAARPRKGARAPKRATDDDAANVETDVEDLWRLVRRAAPFAELPRASFEGVLDMLSGRYPSDELAELRPRITWDRARGVITPRAGSKRLAVQNAGTIPDRGLYGVFLFDGTNGGDDATPPAMRGPTKGASRRVGELDEEMVFELREGEVFLLGASSWRAEKITRDRVLVTPAVGVPGKMPFWHGERAGRTYAFGKRLGALTRRIAERPAREAARLLAREAHLDARATDDLVSYVKEQTSTAVPTDEVIVVEHVPDELGDLRVCVMTPFGARVHQPWAMAALAMLREARSGDIDAVATDDGIIFRVPGGEPPPDAELLFPRADEVEEMVTRELGTSSLFAARFREAAARALLLPRSAGGKRTALWAQRKRAADLLAVASRYPSFPIVLETYRECLREAFDLPSLVALLRAIESRSTRVVTVATSTPSPMAASLLFSFVGSFLYDADAPAAERRAQALTIDQAQLRELLGEAEQRSLLDPDVLLEHGRRLQRLDRPIKDADGLHDLLLWLGDLTEDEIARRESEPGASKAWIAALLSARRVVRARIAGETRYVAVEDAARYRDALGVVLERGLPAALLERTEGPLVSLLARYARTHVPFTADDVAVRFGLGAASAAEALETLIGRGRLVTGAFLPPAERPPRGEQTPVEYVDVEVLRALKQRSLARLRKAVEPVSPAAFARFLLAWQGVSGAAVAHDGARPRAPSAASHEALLRAVGQLEGCPLPASVLEREILPARVPGYAPHMLDQLLATGEVVWAGIEPLGQRDGRVALYLADREPLLARDPPREDDGSRRASTATHEALRELLTRRGALFFAEIARTVGGYPGDVLEALWDLVWTGEATNDTFEPLRSLGRRDDRRVPRARVARTTRLGPRGSEGRWSLRRARWASSPSSTERATALARSLLERYGVVLREAAQAEGLPGGFANVYDVLRALEDQGRVRRGYFVAERGATQFAVPGAEERLRALRDDDAVEGGALVLSATDPASPWGTLLPWPRNHGAPRGPTGGSLTGAQRVAGARVVVANGELLAWIGRGGQSLVTFLPEDEPAASRAASTLADTLTALATRTGRPFILATIDGEEAPGSDFGARLTTRGFVARGGALVYLPPRRALARDAELDVSLDEQTTEEEEESHDDGDEDPSLAPEGGTRGRGAHRGSLRDAAPRAR